MSNTNVLVIDSDLDRCSSIVKCLQSSTGGSLRIVGQGFDLTEALHELEDVVSIDVLVINIDRPDMRHSVTWMEVRLLLPGTRIVALTHGDDQILRAALAAGVAALHTPYVGCEELSQAVQHAAVGQVDYGTRLLEKARQLLLKHRSETEVRCGGLCIDPPRGTVSRWGVNISVTPLELKLLALLAENLGRPVSTTELLEAVWGVTEEMGGTEAQVKNSILRIRKKIEPVPSHPRYLITHGGKGYLLKDPLTG